MGRYHNGALTLDLGRAAPSECHTHTRTHTTAQPSGRARAWVMPEEAGEGAEIDSALFALLGGGPPPQCYSSKGAEAAAAIDCSAQSSPEEASEALSDAESEGGAGEADRTLFELLLAVLGEDEVSASESAEAFAQLLAKGATLHSSRALHCCAANGDAAFLEMLVELAEPEDVELAINARDGSFSTPLMIAAEAAPLVDQLGHPVECCTKLLDLGADRRFQQKPFCYYYILFVIQTNLYF